MAFQLTARVLPEYFPKTKPVLLEPVMKLEIEAADELPRYRGRRTHQPRRGLIIGTEMRRHDR
jgi:translation elongation factor EF-G